MIEFKFARFLSGVAALGLATAPIALQAQAQGDATASAPVASDNPLGIPNDVQLLGKMDPNVRTATAVVNGDVITGTDIDQRVALVVDASKGKVSDEEMQRLKMQVLRNLIDETLQIQAAKAQEIAVSDAEIQQQYDQVAVRNFGQDAAAMDKYLRSVGSSPASLKRQIEGEIAWQRLLQRNVTPFVNVSREEVREVLQRAEEDKGTEEYRLGEIYLSATAENREAVQQNATRIVQQLQQGGSFVAYARQFSEASTAAVGGDLGFVRLNTLPTEMADVARGMQPGQLVGPFEIPGGFEILYLIDKRQIAMADPRNAVLSLKQISISFPAGTTNEQAEKSVAQFGTAVQSMRGCGDAESVAATVGADVVTNDDIRVAQLPQQLQNTILGLQIGQTTPMFGSVEDGVRVLMLCGRDDPEAAGTPDFDQVMNRLEDERIGKRAQRYLRDLRNDAYIEYN